jgi:hypothetical protein
MTDEEIAVKYKLPVIERVGEMTWAYREDVLAAIAAARAEQHAECVRLLREYVETPPTWGDKERLVGGAADWLESHVAAKRIYAAMDESDANSLESAMYNVLKSAKP